MKPLLDLDFRTTYVEGGVLYTPSKGSLVTKAVMGTGVVGNANAPAITPIGASFDGGDYLTTDSTSIVDHDRPFTMVLRGRVPTAALSQVFFGNYNATDKFLLVRTQSNGQLYFAMQAVAGVFIAATANSIRPNRPNTYVATYDGSGAGTGMRLYFDGVDQTVSQTGTGVSATTQNAAVYRISGYPTGSYPMATGASMRRFQVFPFCMTAAQVRAIHERFEREGES